MHHEVATEPNMLPRCECERNPPKPVTHFTNEQFIFQHVVYHFESQPTET